MSNSFVSYSRKDRDIVAAIARALRAAGEEVWVDLDDIVPSAVWMDEIKTAIANADSVIFVISPDSAASEVCNIELKYAVELSKRIVPVVVRETAAATVPPGRMNRVSALSLVSSVSMANSRRATCSSVMTL